LAVREQELIVVRGRGNWLKWNPLPCPVAMRA
jgi:hypothetical protein